MKMSTSSGDLSANQSMFGLNPSSIFSQLPSRIFPSSVPHQVHLPATNHHPFNLHHHSLMNNTNGGGGDSNNVAPPPAPPAAAAGGKLKRCRQRVDAGEPRHVYQGPPKLHFSSLIPVAEHPNSHENSVLKSWDKNSFSPFSQSPTLDSANAFLDVLSQFQKEQQHQKPDDKLDADDLMGEEGEEEEKEEKCELEFYDEGDEAVASAPRTDFGRATNDPSSSLLEGKPFEPSSRCGREATSPAAADELLRQDPATPTAIVGEATATSHSTSSGGSSSSSRRKRFYPTKKQIDEEVEPIVGDGEYREYFLSPNDNGLISDEINGPPSLGEEIDDGGEAVRKLEGGGRNSSSSEDLNLSEEHSSVVEGCLSPSLNSRQKQDAAATTTAFESKRLHCANPNDNYDETAHVLSENDDKQAEKKHLINNANRHQQKSNQSLGGDLNSQNSNLNNWIASMHNFHRTQNYFDMLQMQRRFIASTFGHQQRPQQHQTFQLPSQFSMQMKQHEQLFGGASADQGGRSAAAAAQVQAAQQMEIQQNCVRMAQALKDELISQVNGTIDKIVGDFSSTEQQANAARILAAMSLVLKQQQQVALGLSTAACPPFASAQPPSNNQNNKSGGPSNILSPSAAARGNGDDECSSTPKQQRFQHPPSSYLPTSFFQQNSLMAAAALAATTPMHQHESAAACRRLPTTTRNGGGIFPHSFGELSAPKTSTAAAFSMPTTTNCSLNHLTDEDIIRAPKKKRSKVTDTVRGGKRSAVQHRESSCSLPVSERSSPLVPGGYCVQPTMVAQPSFHQHLLHAAGGYESDQNSGDGSEYEGVNTDQLTNIHLRKAKLMFFYTRYPNSALLKSYFPDVNFDKGLTAQLVKWFSNFREFFYMQVEKFAKQALAEGIVSSDQLHLNEDSEIFKMIYKEIQPLDDTIPEIFKTSRFNEMLQHVT